MLEAQRLERQRRELELERRRLEEEKTLVATQKKVTLRFWNFKFCKQEALSPFVFWFTL